MNRIEEQQHQEQSALDPPITTDPTPEQLKALAVELEKILTFRNMEIISAAANHLRAYAEQIGQLDGWRTSSQQYMDLAKSRFNELAQRDGLTAKEQLDRQQDRIKGVGGVVD